MIVVVNLVVNLAVSHAASLLGGVETIFGAAEVWAAEALAAEVAFG